MDTIWIVGVCWCVCEELGLDDGSTYYPEREIVLKRDESLDKRRHPLDDNFYSLLLLKCII